jgi:hypothetical protein
MASPDALGWPDEAAGSSFGSARDESRLMAVGLGWPQAADGTSVAAAGAAGAWLGWPGRGRATGETCSAGQGQVLAQVSRAAVRG